MVRIEVIAITALIALFSTNNQVDAANAFDAGLRGAMDFGNFTIGFVNEAEYPEIIRDLTAKGVKLKKIDAGVDVVDRRHEGYNFVALAGTTSDDACLVEFLYNKSTIVEVNKQCFLAGVEGAVTAFMHLLKRLAGYVKWINKHLLGNKTIPPFEKLLFSKVG